MSSNNGLTYEVFINDPPPGNGVLPNGEPKRFSPLASTLLLGSTDAVLVDPGLTAAQAGKLVEWVAKSGRNLTDIFVTHGHGDHWFAASLVTDRFDARVVATAGTIEVMHGNVAARPFVWDKAFEGIPDSPVTAVSVPGNRFRLEEHDLVIVDAGHTDTEQTSVLHVPDLGLVVAGDVIYNGAHLYLGESVGSGLDPWRRAIDQVEALNPRSIVSGHKRPDLDDDARRTIAETREYLDVAEEALRKENSAVSYFDAMIERYPDRIGRFVLWSTAQALYGVRDHPDEDPVQFVAGGWL